jgi:hypothetical protein
MARQTNNRLVQNLDGGGKKTFATTAAAFETENARFDMIGPFRHANCAIDLAGVQMTLGGVDADAPAGIVAPRAGAIVGISYAFDAAITAGGATAAQLQASIAPGGVAGAVAVQGDKFAVASGASGLQSAVLDETKGSISKGLEKGAIPFNEGDFLGIQVSTSHTFAPVTDDVDAYLLVRYAT